MYFKFELIFQIVCVNTVNRNLNLFINHKWKAHIFNQIYLKEYQYWGVKKLRLHYLGIKLLKLHYLVY